MCWYFPKNCNVLYLLNYLLGKLFFVMEESWLGFSLKVWFNLYIIFYYIINGYAIALIIFMIPSGLYLGEFREAALAGGIIAVGDVTLLMCIYALKTSRRTLQRNGELHRMRVLPTDFLRLLAAYRFVWMAYYVYYFFYPWYKKDQLTVESVITSLLLFIPYHYWGGCIFYSLAGFYDRNDPLRPKRERKRVAEPGEVYELIQRNLRGSQ